ncbi:response regulator [Marinicauda salina]|uniref:response regulator n=1 Tax=Marinicauda salina TaxID=2135793 RepID=UPI001304E60A|nr:response regulator [Marinicauda salina]
MASAGDKSGLEPHQVGVIDDNPAVRGLLRSILSAAGCRSVFEAADAESALRMVREQSLDLLICDWKMPTMDGVALLRRLRDEHGAAAPPAIMLTAYDGEARTREAREAGADSLLTKPITPAALLDAIAALATRDARARPAARLHEAAL